MGRSILRKLGWQNLWQHKKVFLPYVLALTLLFAMTFVFFSLMQNDYIIDREAALPQLIGVGATLSTIIIFIIALYGTHFVSRQQAHTFGVYSVLGLESKHLRAIIRFQYVILWGIISLLSGLTGYILGQVSFLFLNKLMRHTGATVMDYEFQPLSLLLIVTILAGVFILAYIRQATQIYRLEPAELIRQVNKGEAEPKSRWLMGLIGLACIAGGYYMALTAKGILTAVGFLFAAALLVMIGTYLVFISVSIIVLKLLRKKRQFYYRPHPFLNISQMLFRMKSNAVSLSSIAILCAGIILTVTTTLTLYRGIEKQVANIMPEDYTIHYPADDPSKQEVDDLLAQIKSDLQAEDVSVSKAYTVASTMVPASFAEDKLTPLTEQTPKAQPVYVIAEEITDYNKQMGTHIELGENEVLMTANNLDTKDLKKIELLGDQTVTVKPAAREAISSNYGVDMLYIAVPNREMLEEINDYYISFNPQTNEQYENKITYDSYLTVANDSKAVHTKLQSLGDKYPIGVESRLTSREEIYALNGGLLFIGILISMLLLIGVLLMMYFKQISESYEDKKAYRIMQQVGLPQSLIKQSICQQIIWLFGLPLLVAIIHNLFAMPLMNKTLGLLAVSNLFIYIQDMAITVVIFILIYLVAYALTSRVYYQMIKE